jgi:Fe-S cluster assembly protein SufD
VFENALYIPHASKYDTNAVMIETHDTTTHISVIASQITEITIVHVTQGNNAQSHAHIHYTIKENTAAQITEIHCSTNETSKISSIETTLSLEKNSQCEYINIQDLGTDTECAQTITVQQEQNSQFTAHVYQLQGDILHTTLNIDKNDTQAHTALYGLSYPKSTQRFECNTLVKHNCTDCETVENFKILATDQSFGVFGGMIYVAPHAVRTIAKQSNKNMLLSPNARIFSKPQLEIYADDVSCNHGSSTGQLNEDALWYMQARGIAPEQARQLLIQAVVCEITDMLPKEELRELINSVLR